MEELSVTENNVDSSEWPVLVTDNVFPRSLFCGYLYRQEFDVGEYHKA
jgi:hypothetical protein